MTTFPQSKEPVIPSEVDTQLSQLGSCILAAYFQRVCTSTQKIKILEFNSNEQVIDIPFFFKRIGLTKYMSGDAIFSKIDLT